MLEQPFAALRPLGPRRAPAGDDDPALPRRERPVRGHGPRGHRDGQLPDHQHQGRPGRRDRRDAQAHPRPLPGDRGFPSGAAACSSRGIGRAHNLHIASLPDFKLPSDLSASRRYYREDLIDPSDRAQSPTARSGCPRDRASASTRSRRGSSGRRASWKS